MLPSSWNVTIEIEDSDGPRIEVLPVTARSEEEAKDAVSRLLDNADLLSYVAGTEIESPRHKIVSAVRVGPSGDEMMELMKTWFQK